MLAGAAPTIHDAHGWWIAEAGSPAVRPALEGDVAADVVVIGGGYTGMWSAWHVLEADPDARVAVLEAGRCGHGPSGRNGGFVSGMALSRPTLVERFGAGPAKAWVDAAAATVDAIGAWCEAEGVDAWYRRGGELVVSTAPAQDGVGADAVDGTEVVALDGAAARARVASPVVRGGVYARTGANVHPARLAFGLRGRLLARGVAVYEGCRARALRGGPGGVVVETAGGRVRARAAIVAAGAAAGALAPLRDRLTVASSHIVCTEPVPDVVEALGWTGGESVSDGRALLHYTRTTRDGRIVFGWAGGRMGAGARTGRRMEVDHDIAAQARRDLLRFFPMLPGRQIAHAWGGPIDVSPTHLPVVASLPGLPAWAAFGYTGNGVGPSHLLGRTLASLALDRRDPVTRLPFVDGPLPRVPPEPLRIAGAAVVRRALVRKEAAEEAGGRADPVTRVVADLPRRVGLHIVR
jgi:glycine/D-amino acid oxidase-like deaminating enzyme